MLVFANFYLQIGKGRSVVARAIAVGAPRDVARVVLSLFSVMGSCPKKCLDDVSVVHIRHILFGYLVMVLSCVNAFVFLFYLCPKRAKLVSF